ncbi:PqiC family protein [Pseudomonas xionganensis]|uniref:ABC-type transport auxiliary lipoprotein component domain-containing protein n=1 Tax=Pseudomonas xionganensis TaxID=2654845 RepID=A0A6I4KRD9_9PSED|nr:ABC-type transport auxiliary lipoprotein family protein [Pseudomonas xionganensis]MVW74657.1 hypothetical protein [Pseudomonas xionganensis]
MNTMRKALAILVVGSLGLAGCTAYRPVPLYQLDGGEWQMPGEHQGVALLLGPVTVADYLQREALLQRQADGSLISADNARWAGNLANEIDQQLLRQLAARLDSQRVQLAPASPGFEPTLRLALSITRLDSGPQQAAVLEAQWRLSGADGKLLDGRLVRLEESHNGAVADQVRAQSLLLQQLVGLLAQATREYGKAPVVATPPRKPAVSKPIQPPAPRIPVAEPSRNEGEVFRF